MSGESVRQRASVEFKKWIAKQPEHWQALDLTEFWVAFAESESSLARKQEREECAKAVCMSCRQGEPVLIAGTESAYHRGTYCTAAAIHERGRKVEG